MSDEVLRQREYWNREIDSFDAIYSRRKNRFSQWLDRTFRKDMFERYEYTLAHAEPIRGRDFLDVGCGTGRYVFDLARRGCRHATGIDISEHMIDHCRRTAEDSHLSGKVEFTLTDLINYTPAQRYHVCIGIGLFDYISEPLPVLKKMRDCVDDCVIVSFPRLFSWRAPVRKIRLGLRGCDVRFFTLRRITTLLSAAGFKNHSLEKVGKLYCVTARVG
jgi:SAM-dependent methyltransferase